MKIILLNGLNPKIIEVAQKINGQYFKDLAISVGLYQSEKHEVLCVDLNEKTSSVIVPKEDASVLSNKFNELEEIIDHFSEEIKIIIWLGKSVYERETTKIKHIVAHELKHVEQQITNPVSCNKDRVLDCFFYGSSQKKKTPAEKDADNFANMVIGKSYDNAYSWTKETNQLFNENEDVIKQLYRKIKENGDEILFDDTVFLANKEERKLFCHFYEKAYRT